MQVDVSFSIAKVYDVNNFDVVKGEKFKLFTQLTQASNWFSDNDPVLDLVVTGNSAQAEAKILGQSVILIMDENFTILKKLIVKVVDAIVEPATDLGITAGQAEQKS